MTGNARLDPCTLDTECWYGIGVTSQTRIPYVITEHSTFFVRGLVSTDEMALAGEVAIQANRRFAVSLPFCDLLINQLSNEVGQWEPMPNIVNQAFLDHSYQQHTYKNQSLRFCLQKQKPQPISFKRLQALCGAR